MRQSHNAHQFVNAIIAAADRLDLELVTAFVNQGLEASQLHLNLVGPTLSGTDQVKQERILNQGVILLHLVIALNNPREI